MKKSLISLFSALALILVILLAGNIITIGDKLAGASPVLAWGFYLLLAAALVWLVVLPFWMRMPRDDSVAGVPSSL